MDQLIYEIERKKDGEKLDCFAQMMPFRRGETVIYSLCYNIGILNYQGWHNISCEDDDDRFNAKYKVLGVKKTY